MPVYKYQCGNCGKLTERKLPISQRKDPVGEVCSTNGCGGVNTLIVGSPSTVSGVKDHTEVPDGFKDVLREIKKNSGKDCTIDV